MATNHPDRPRVERSGSLHLARAVVASVVVIAGCRRTAYRTYTCPEPPPSRSAATVRVVGERFVGGVVLRADSATPSPWAFVLLRPDSGGREQQQQVREVGRFRFPVPAPGTYTLRVRSLSLATLDVPLRLPPDSGAELRLDMEYRPVVINELCGARIAVPLPWWHFW